MAEQSNPTTSRRRHHRRHRRNSRKRKLRNGVLIATIAVGMLTVLGLKLIGRGKDIRRRSSSAAIPCG